MVGVIAGDGVAGFRKVASCEVGMTVGTISSDNNVGSGVEIEIDSRESDTLSKSPPDMGVGSVSPGLGLGGKKASIKGSILTTRCCCPGRSISRNAMMLPIGVMIMSTNKNNIP
ncbi:MAG: hypothetical protein K8L99_17265 [Anaerolineae bacterium]|nr:hypothetical protein [Anaerolineae bacterium]